MAKKISQAQKFAQSLAIIKHGEDKVTAHVKAAISNYWKESGNTNMVGFVYTGLVIANKEGALRPAQEKAITDFIVKFCSVSTKKDMNGATLYRDNGDVILVKDKEKHDKKAKSLNLVGLSGDELTDKISILMNDYLAQFGGSLFGKKSKKETAPAKDESEMTSDEKLLAIAERKKAEAASRKRNVSGVTKLATDQAMDEAARLDHLLEIAKALGFANLNDALQKQSALIAMPASTETIH